MRNAPPTAPRARSTRALIKRTPARPLPPNASTLQQPTLFNFLRPSPPPRSPPPPSAPSARETPALVPTPLPPSISHIPRTLRPPPLVSFPLTCILVHTPAHGSSGRRFRPRHRTGRLFRLTFFHTSYRTPRCATSYLPPQTLIYHPIHTCPYSPPPSPAALLT